MKKYITIIIVVYLVLGILVYLFEPISLINVFIFFIVTILSIFGYEILKKEIEISLADKYFPVFFKNLSRSIEVGIAPIRALIEISKEKYGEITKHFRIFKRKLESSISIDKAFEYLEEKFKSNRKIFNSLKILNHELKSGYGLKEAIDSLYDFILKISEVERERKVIISQFTILFYAISLVIVAIIIVLVKVLVPIYTQFLETSQQAQPICLTYGTFSMEEIICNIYIAESKLFKKEVKNTTEAYMLAVLVNLALLQAAFSGLIIGYGAEKSLAKGVIHLVILFTVTFLIFIVLGRIGFL
ncbi:MAG: type II secretion system F family protein [Candidatus Aenigmatarchaeota archaeon]